MILKADRTLFFESYLFNVILAKSPKMGDITFMNDPKYKVSLKDINNSIQEMKTRQNLPVLRQILNALTEQRIQLVCAPNNTSGVVYIPMMDKDKREIIGVRINISRVAKKKMTVNSLTGDTQEIVDINYEMLYTLLFGALAILNTNRCYNNPNLTKYLRTIYVDIVQQIMNRTFGNPIYGDKFRFVLAYFFHNGEIGATDLANNIKFDIGKAKILENSYPEFFSKKGGITIEDLLELIAEEFPNMKDVSIDKFVSGAITMLGESAFYILDNQAYFLGVCAVRCRKEGKDVFGGMLLKLIDADKSQISNLILQSV